MTDTDYKTWSDERREREKVALQAVRCFLRGMPCDIDGVPRETHQRRLEQRQRQIAIGKKTPSYRFYADHMPKETRPMGIGMDECPRTPPPELKCSKRGFDAIVRRWRRALHAYCQVHPDAPLALKRPRIVALPDPSPCLDDEDYDGDYEEDNDDNSDRNPVADPDSQRIHWRVRHGNARYMQHTV